jgi:alpha-D-xyloside xylohydrolase
MLTVVNWEGSPSNPDFTGVHQFLFRYGGYGKLWVDGKLLADRWRQSWNPGTSDTAGGHGKRKAISF